MSLAILRPKTWNAVQDALFADAWDPAIRRFRSRDAYRGLSDADHPLTTSLVRVVGENLQLESHLLRNFKKYAHKSLVESDSLWHWLSLAQHHGLPTRLLDWTYSPYVALHFATCNLDKFDTDGVVWRVNYAQAHDSLPAKLKRALKKQGGMVFTTETLADAIWTLPELDALRGKGRDFVIFFEPPSIDDRIVNQFAYFSVLSNPRLAMNEWLAANPADSAKIIIPKQLKWEIRDKLDQANITERVLFPGLDGLCRWLTRHYSPGPAE